MFLEALAEGEAGDAAAYDDYAANGASWTAQSPEVAGMVRLIGGNPDDVVGALKLLGFPTQEQQVSEAWLGGGALKALQASAEFLKDQGQIDQVLSDYTPYVNASFAQQAKP